MLALVCIGGVRRFNCTDTAQGRRQYQGSELRDLPLLLELWLLPVLPLLMLLYVELLECEVCSPSGGASRGPVYLEHFLRWDLSVSICREGC